MVCPCVSVIIPVRNEECTIARTVRAVLSQREAGFDLEVVVVDDGSTDGTAAAAADEGAIVVSIEAGHAGNPAAARNRGAQGWLRGFLEAHAAGETVVGGALDLPHGLSLTARCDYYCGWYLVHSRRPAGHVPHHPPPNLSVRREAFFSTSGFTEVQPFSYTNEERAWQGELQRRGHRIYFEPRALAYHHNRSGFWNLLRRNYRWAYTAIPAKSHSGSARVAWIYRKPRLMIAASLPLALVHTIYILGCWTRAGVFEPLLMFPVVFASRLAYMAGMAIGGVRWLRSLRRPETQVQPRWK
jgi:glycosyltransferase involved in cell wall biosynthesis